MGFISNLLQSIGISTTTSSPHNNTRSGNVFWWSNNQGNTSLQSLQVWLNMDGSIRVWTHTYFSLLKKNATISAALRFLSNKVGWYGFYFVDSSGKAIKWQEEMKRRVEQFFSIPKLRTYIYVSIANYIVSGQKVSTATELNQFWTATGNATINILDPRMLTIKTDTNTWEIISYEYRNNTVIKEFEPQIVNNDILYPDLDRDGYGQSQMDGIVIDALTEYVLWSRQFHFYRNNATPSTVFMIDPTVVTDDTKAKELETKINEKFGWNANNWKPMATTALRDVKTIEVPDIKLIEERELIMKILTMVFGIDPRVLWYMKETGWSYAEIDAIARNMTNAKLEEWTSIIENSMNEEFNKYIKPLGYRIKLDTIYFKNTEKDKEIALQEVKAWVMSVDEYKSLFNM